MTGTKEEMAYVTFLAGGNGDDSWSWKGACELSKGLRKVGSAFPLVVAVPPDMPESHRQILVSEGCIVREFDPLYPELELANYSKLRIWEFVDYSRMVYLEPELQVLDNIDDLFELEKGYFYAVKNCFCSKAWSHTLQHSIGYCQYQQRFPEDKVAGRPIGELGLPPAPYFNAGVFVLEPSLETTKALLDALRVTPVTPFAEQDFLNMFFKEKYKPIPIEYNFVLDTMLKHPEYEHLAKNAKVVHVQNYAARLTGGEKLPPPFGSWLARTVLARQNLPAMATLIASSAALGVVIKAADPAMCFAFYTVFLVAIATVIFSLRGI